MNPVREEMDFLKITDIRVRNEGYEGRNGVCLGGG